MTEGVDCNASPDSELCRMMKACPGGKCPEPPACDAGDGGRCETCEPGSVSLPGGQCVPSLSDLKLSAGELSPRFTAEQTQYHVSVPLLTAFITLTPRAPQGVSVTIDDAPLARDGAWASPALQLGATPIRIMLTADGDKTTREITLTVLRGPGAESLLETSAQAQSGSRVGRPIAISGDTIALGGIELSGDKFTPSAAPVVETVHVLVRGKRGFAEQASVQASNQEAGDGFGESLALEGDTLVVGAPRESSGNADDESDNSLSASGAVYVFVREGDAWSQLAYLKADTLRSGDQFGQRVAIAGDTIAVGAPSETTVDEERVGGTVYIFSRDGDRWSQQASLQATNARRDDGFGGGLGLSGDTLAVGAVGDSSDATRIDGDATNTRAVASGAVHVFTRSKGSWSLQAYLKGSASAANHRVGGDVAIAGDTIVAGELGAGNYSGAAYVFARNGSKWSEQARLLATVPEPKDYFGYSVAISGDTIVVGADGEASRPAGLYGDPNDNSTPDTGAAFVFQRSGQRWLPSLFVKPPDTPGTIFGAYVALGDGVLVVGDCAYRAYVLE